MPFTSSEIDKFRNDTPGVQEVIHFNNAGASLISEPVWLGMKNYLEYELKYGGYEAMSAHADALAFAPKAISQLINAEGPNQIACLESATVAWYKAFYGFQFNEGDIILTCIAEYGSNYIGLLQAQKQWGVSVQIVPNDATGQLDIAALESMINDRVKLIAITHMPTNGGLVNPVEEVGVIARKHNIPYLLDACQTVGQYPVDVAKIRCDILSATGRKFLRAPRGTGFLYVAPNLLSKLEPPMPDLHAAQWIDGETYQLSPTATRFENFEKSYAGRVGLGIAADYANSVGIERIWQRISGLGEYFRAQLSQISGIEIHDQGEIKGGIVTFSVSGKSPKQIQEMMVAQKINVSMSLVGQARLDMGARGLTEIVRASVHYYNTTEEIDRFCEILKMDN